MTMIVSRLAMLIAAMSMAFVPIAAQANTRAGDSGAIYAKSALAQPGLARGIDGSNLANNDDDDDDDGAAWILGLFAGALIIAALILVDGSDDQSPGT